MDDITSRGPFSIPNSVLWGMLGVAAVCAFLYAAPYLMEYYNVDPVDVLGLHENRDYWRAKLYKGAAADELIAETGIAQPRSDVPIGSAAL